MNIGDSVNVTSLDGLVQHGEGVIDSIGNAHAGGARAKMADGNIIEVGYYKVTKTEKLPVTPQSPPGIPPFRSKNMRKRPHSSKRIV
jgi:hypothetical protein